VGDDESTDANNDKSFRRSGARCTREKQTMQSIRSKCEDCVACNRASATPKAAMASTDFPFADLPAEMQLLTAERLQDMRAVRSLAAISIGSRTLRDLMGRTLFKTMVMGEAGLEWLREELHMGGDQRCSLLNYTR
jgi:hypothetical protein